VLVEPNGDGRLLMEVVAPENPDVDIWSARRRAKMFEKEFERSLSIRWRSEAQSAETAGNGAAPADRRIAGG
jgi:hypothetical protein